MVRGRPPKPAGLRLVEGTDRKGRSGRLLDRSREPVALAGEMVPPYDMAAPVRAVWDKTVSQLEAMQLASPADVNQIAAYCEAAALHARASRALAGQPLTVEGSRSQVTNKLVMIQERAA